MEDITLAQAHQVGVLFDFDGVVADTETQYSHFWHEVGKRYLDMDDIEVRVKGQTLDYIYRTFFAGRMADQAEITRSLDQFERQMRFDYVPGVVDFVQDLRRHGVATAVVTSSNEKKMEAVYKARPEIKSMFGHILTAERFSASKPAPDCFLLGMQVLGVNPANTCVFEDSFNGLKAGMASGAYVVGLATTNPAESIAPLCHKVIKDFREMDFVQMQACLDSDWK